MLKFIKNLSKEFKSALVLILLILLNSFLLMFSLYFFALIVEIAIFVGIVIFFSSGIKKLRKELRELKNDNKS